jgi:hypothetical protein
MADVVKYGRYRWFTRPMLDEERAKYVQAVQMMTSQAAASGGGRIIQGSMGGTGTSFYFPSGVDTLEQWADDLESAFAQLDAEEEITPAVMSRAVIGVGGVK